MEIRIDEEFKTLMPPLGEDEYKLLEESLKADGCRDPITLWHGVIIDGYTRYEICQKNGIKYKTVSKTRDDLENRDMVKLWIIKNQFARRNLTDYDRGRLALQLKPIISEKRKRGRPKKENRANLPELQTRAEIAKIADLSERSVDKIEKIENQGSEELKEKARKGKISIDAAYYEAKNTKKKKEEKEPKKEPQKREVSEARDFATIAISQLERIRLDDPQREKELTRVLNWIVKNRKEVNL